MLPYSPASFTPQRNSYSPHPFQFPIWLTTQSKSRKAGNKKGFPFTVSLLLCTDFFRNIYFEFLSFFSGVKASKIATTHVSWVVFTLQEKNKQWNNNIMKSSWLPNNASNWFTFIILSTLANNFWPAGSKQSNDSYLQENEEL